MGGGTSSKQLKANTCSSQTTQVTAAGNGKAMISNGEEDAADTHVGHRVRRGLEGVSGEVLILFL